MTGLVLYRLGLYQSLCSVLSGLFVSGLCPRAEYMFEKKQKIRTNKLGQRQSQTPFSSAFRVQKDFENKKSRRNFSGKITPSDSSSR